MGALVTGFVLGGVAYGMEQVSSDLKPEQDVFVAFDIPVTEPAKYSKFPLTIDKFVGKKLFGTDLFKPAEAMRNGPK